MNEQMKAIVNNEIFT